VVDEAVVVDTGSVDDTPEFARRLGARVLHHPWTGDFSDARNVSLDAARGRWILYIDADERLSGTTRADVEQLLENAREVAFRVLFQPTVGATPYREYRLWRNDPRIRFEGIIHEKVVPSIHRVAELEGRPVGLADLMLVHLGYEGDQTRKHRRNLPLLRRQLEVEPTNLFAWNHLGRVLDGLGEREEAERVWCQAIELARRGSCGDPVGVLSYADLLQLRHRRGENVDDLLAEARRAYPDDALLLWIEARTSMDAGRFEKAVAVLDEILSTDWLRRRDFGPAYDRRLLEEAPWAAKGLCLFRLGRYEEAASAYEMAAAAAPGDSSYRVKARLAKAKATAQGRTA
jgi:tetratricopeptide (TPR) repeat protein